MCMEEARLRGKSGSLTGKTSFFFFSIYFFVLHKNQAEVTTDTAFSAGIFAIFPFKVRAVCRGSRVVLAGAVGVEPHPCKLRARARAGTRAERAASPACSVARV